MNIVGNEEVLVDLADGSYEVREAVLGAKLDQILIIEPDVGRRYELLESPDCMSAEAVVWPRRFQLTSL